MKVYTIENDVIIERELSEDMGRFRYIDEDGFTVFIKDSDAFQTWKEARDALERKKYRAVKDAELQALRARVDLLEAQRRYESVINMKGPE